MCNIDVSVHADPKSINLILAHLRQWEPTWVGVGKRAPKGKLWGVNDRGWLFSPCRTEDSMGMFVVNVHFMKKKLQVVLCGKVIANVMEAILIISESLNVERKTIVASSEMCLEQ